MALAFTSGSSTASASVNLSGTSSVTLVYWFYVTAWNSVDIIMELTSNFNSYTTGWLVAQETSAMYHALKGDVGANREDYASRPSTGAWHHVVCRMNKTLGSQTHTAGPWELETWLDGADPSVAARPSNNNFSRDNTNAFANDTLYFGQRGDVPSFGMDGYLAEVAIYNGDLLSDAAHLYRKSPLLVKPESLLYYWPMWNDGRELIQSSDISLTNVGTGPHPQVIMPSQQILPLDLGAAAAGSYTIYENYYRQLMAGSHV